MKVFAFDVDDTLDLDIPLSSSFQDARGWAKYRPGPVRLDHITELRSVGHVVGICGNWRALSYYRPDWQQYFGFIGPVESSFKASFLQGLKRGLQYNPEITAFVMVGNIAQTAIGDDRRVAKQSGWEFQKETEFVDRLK